jgi:hypothetical protein
MRRRACGGGGGVVTSKQPTEPGFYWALLTPYGRARQTWQPVEVVDDGGMVAFVIGGDTAHLMISVVEWGPRIPEYQPPRELVWPGYDANGSEVE